MNQDYSDKIKDHYHHPRNAGKPAAFDHVAEQINPLCGDETKVYLKITNGVITDISHETRGCMITVAAASILSKYAVGRSITDLKKLGAKDISKMLEVEISPARSSCATLVIKALGVV